MTGVQTCALPIFAGLMESDWKAGQSALPDKDMHWRGRNVGSVLEPAESTDVQTGETWPDAVVASAARAAASSILLE